MTIDRPETYPVDAKPARKSKTIIINSIALLAAFVVGFLLKQAFGMEIRPDVEAAMGSLAAAAITNIVLRFKTSKPLGKPRPNCSIKAEGTVKVTLPYTAPGTQVSVTNNGTEPVVIAGLDGATINPGERWVTKKKKDTKRG